MSIKTHITDPATGRKACVADDSEENALVVATRPLKTYNNKIAFFTNVTYGNALNQNAAAGGTPENVHNGTDNVYWTASSIVGTQYTFDSVARFHTGTKSILVNGAAVGNVMQIAKGGNLTVSGYVSLTIWINVDSAWAAGDSISVYGYDTGTASQIGTAVNLEDYFSWGVFDTWHLISIPLTDMALTAGTIDAIRIETLTKQGGPPVFYMDDIQFQETGAPIEFRVEPDKGTWLKIKGFNIVMADAFDNTVANASSPNIPYDKLLGVATLNTGIVYKRVQAGKTLSTASIRQFSDIMSFSEATVTGNGGDGTNTWVSVNIKFTEEVILKYEEEDYMSLTISEDLSGLLIFTMSASAKIEERSS